MTSTPYQNTILTIIRTLITDTITMTANMRYLKIFISPSLQFKYLTTKQINEEKQLRIDITQKMNRTFDYLIVYFILSHDLRALDSVISTGMLCLHIQHCSSCSQSSQLNLTRLSLEAHYIRHASWTNLVDPLHMHGLNNSSRGQSYKHILQQHYSMASIIGCEGAIYILFSTVQQMQTFLTKILSCIFDVEFKHQNLLFDLRSQKLKIVAKANNVYFTIII